MKTIGPMPRTRALNVSPNRRRQRSKNDTGRPINRAV